MFASVLILGISYTDHVTNEEIHKIIVQHVGHCEDLLTTVKKRKLRWYGHVTRSIGLSNTILQGKVHGRRRRRRHIKRWRDNTEEWIVKTFAETQALADNRQDWSRLVKRSLEQRPTTQAGYGISTHLAASVLTIKAYINCSKQIGISDSNKATY